MSLDSGALFAVEAALLDATATELAATDAGWEGRNCVYPAGELPWDDCECGLLAVNWLNAYPSEVFPQLAVRNVCKVWVVEVVVAVARCAPESDDRDPPSCEALEQAAAIQAEDLRAIQRAIHCVLTGRSGMNAWRWAPNVPVGPSGACLGQEQHVLVGFPDCQVAC